MSTTALTLLVTTLTSVAGLAGGFLLLWKRHWAHKFSVFLVSFAAGTLLAAAFLDLLPEAIGESANPAALFPYVLGGLLLFFLIEKSLLFHHHTHRHEGSPAADLNKARKAALRPLIIFGDAMHNFLDGVIIAATFSVSPALGTTTALAVFFHELPQEIGDFGILLHSGMERRRIALWNLLGALISPLGALLGILALETFEGMTLPLLAISAGGFIYIAAADLIPEIHHETRPGRIVAQVFLLFLGIALLWLVGSLLPEGR